MKREDLEKIYECVVTDFGVDLPTSTRFSKEEILDKWSLLFKKKGKWRSAQSAEKQGYIARKVEEFKKSGGKNATKFMKQYGMLPDKDKFYKIGKIYDEDRELFLDVREEAVSYVTVYNNLERTGLSVKKGRDKLKNENRVETLKKFIGAGGVDNFLPGALNDLEKINAEDPSLQENFLLIGESMLRIAKYIKEGGRVEGKFVRNLVKETGGWYV